MSIQVFLSALPFCFNLKCGLNLALLTGTKRLWNPLDHLIRYIASLFKPVGKVSMVFNLLS